MLELYHNAASTCSQKVRLVLAEKGLDWTSRDVDLVGGQQHDPDYVKLNPNHVVPTLVHDGRALIESTLINEYLEDAFPEPRLTPEDPALRHRMRLWTRRIDAVHPNAGIVTYGIGVRPMMLQRSAAERDAALAAIPDPVARERRRSVIEHGVEAPEMRNALAAFVALLDDLEVALADGAWLAGDAWSLAEASVLPYVMRVDHLAMTPLIDARARVADWYARVRARPSFTTAITERLPQPVIDLFRGNGREVWPRLEQIARGDR